MIKKILLSVILVGFTGALVWGGINRTSAKTGASERLNGQGEGQNQNLGESRGQQHDTNKEENQQESRDDFSLSLEAKGNGSSADLGQDESSNPNGNQSNGNGGRRGGNGGRGQGSDPLDENEINALLMAINDEYHAFAVYQSVMDTFGDVEPFVEIAQSELRHIDALVNHFDKHGIPVPENTWIGEIPPFDSVQSACQAGVVAEIANVDLYDQLFSMVDDPGLVQVFTNLSRASLESHLPEFEACQ